jgi:hypothetical protein
VALDLAEKSLDLRTVWLAALRSWSFTTTAWSWRFATAARSSDWSSITSRSWGFTSAARSNVTASAVSVQLAVELAEQAL